MSDVIELKKRKCTIIKHKNGTFDMVWKDTSGTEPVELKEKYKYCTTLEFLIDENEYDLSPYEFFKSLDDMLYNLKHILRQNYELNQLVETDPVINSNKESNENKNSKRDI